MVEYLITNKIVAADYVNGKEYLEDKIKELEITEKELLAEIDSIRVEINGIQDRIDFIEEVINIYDGVPVVTEISSYYFNFTTPFPITEDDVYRKASLLGIDFEGNIETFYNVSSDVTKMKSVAQEKFQNFCVKLDGDMYFRNLPGGDFDTAMRVINEYVVHGKVPECGLSLLPMYYISYDFVFAGVRIYGDYRVGRDIYHAVAVCNTLNDMYGAGTHQLTPKDEE